MHVPWVLSTSKILTEFTEQNSLLFGKYMNHSRKNLYKHKPNQERVWIQTEKEKMQYPI
jgi:hypothetical protein